MATVVVFAEGLNGQTQVLVKILVEGPHDPTALKKSWSWQAFIILDLPVFKANTEFVCAYLPFLLLLNTSRESRAALHFPPLVSRQAVLTINYIYFPIFNYIYFPRGHTPA